MLLLTSREETPTKVGAYLKALPFAELAYYMISRGMTFMLATCFRKALPYLDLEFLVIDQDQTDTLRLVLH